MIKNTFLGLASLFFMGAHAQVPADKKAAQEQIIDKYLTHGAHTVHFLSPEYQQWIDKGLREDSTIAYLWQQKAMPYWKIRKYELAQQYFDYAVRYDRQSYLSRGIFLKTVFSKQYRSALADYETFNREFHTVSYENDHSLEFYAALCYLGLNEFQQAQTLLLPHIEKIEQQKGTDWTHFVDHFYLGIIHYELGEYAKAIYRFDLALKTYPQFSDAKYWKGKAFIRLGDKEKGENLLREGKADFKNGFTFREDASYYELFPYQITWDWANVK